MSSNLSQNLAVQRVRSSANSAKRKKVIDAVLRMAQEQATTEAPSATLLSPTGSLGLESGSTDDHHDHAPTTGGFNPEFNKNLQRLLNDYKGKVTIGSGYRSPERQAQLFANAVKKYGSEAAARKWVAPPGHSNHNRGLAADLHYTDPSVIAAIHANAAKYGLNFPLANENWHIEPIGIRKK